MLSTVSLDRLGDSPRKVLVAQCVRGPQVQAEEPMELQERNGCGPFVLHLPLTVYYP